MTKRYLINWQDSMALNAKVFNEHDNYIIDSVRDSVTARMTNYNYGLLPIKGEQSDHELQISQKLTDNVNIKLVKCDAITQSGIRIKLDGTQSSELSKTYSVTDDLQKNITQWDIILSVDPYNRKGCGELDPQETPPRHPYTDVTYKLYLMPKGEINMGDQDADYLIIGRIRKTSEKVTVDSEFIPPCTAIKSHYELVNYYNIFTKHIRVIEICSKRIVAKINEREKKDILATNVFNLCADILRFNSEVSFDLQNKGLHYAPIELMSIIAQLAHRIYANLMLLIAIQKEDMLKYFYEWSDIKPGTFEEIITHTLEISYDHSDIRSSMVQAEIFLQNFSDLWSKLSNLQYIGQHKENIVISERTTKQNFDQENSAWSVSES